MSENSRRKLLKSIALGGGAIVSGKSLPEQWARPVVDTMMLPAHARTSLTTFTSGGTLPSADAGMLKNDNLFANLSEAMIEEAQANSFDPQIPCIVDNGDGTVTVDVTIQAGGTRRYQETVTVTAAKKNMGLCQETTSVFEIERDGLGLINDAHAEILVPMVEVRIDSIDGNAMGALFIDTTEEYVIDLPTGPCASAACTPTYPSDRNIKENFSRVDEQEILKKVAALNIEHWSYTDREKGVRHIGPMAQDFMAAFDVGDSERHIHMVDANGVNLAAIKALNSRLEEKEEQISLLQEQLDQILSKLDSLENKT